MCRLNLNLQRFTAVLLVGLFVASFASSNASAMSAAQRNLYNHNELYYDIDGGQCQTDETNGGGSEAVDTPADVLERAKVAFHYLEDHGSNSKFSPPNYTPEQIAGILGNLMWESGVDPKRGEVGGGGGYGLAQWTGGRRTAMRAWVSAQSPPNNDPDELGGQLDFLIHELHTTNAGPDRELRTQTDINSATTNFMLKFERPGDPHLSERIARAHTVYDAVKDDGGFSSGSATPGTDEEIGDEGGADSTDSSSCTTDATQAAAGASADCMGATGNTKILCEAKKYEGIFYRWGGGHGGPDAFHAGCPNPASPPNNQAHGSSVATHNGNPSPCATDCSGLVSIAASEAFGQKFSWTVRSIQSDGANWKKISMSEIKAGDVVTRGNYHVEIVDHPNGATVATFGSHETGTKTGPSVGHYDGAYRYIGPGNE